MKLNVKALTISAGIIWAAAIFLTGLANMAGESYGLLFLRVLASVYPGYAAAGTLGDLIVGTLYGLVDGAVCGFIFAWIYNQLAEKRADAVAPRKPIEP